MNFLAHLVLAGDDEGLRLGAMLGDFVRGSRSLKRYTPDVRTGIMLHRHIDSYIDSLPLTTGLRNDFPRPFRRYAGIIMDLCYDHELTRRFSDYSEVSLAEFDRGVREMLARHEALLPDRLKRFMLYADRRGLFESYSEKSEILRALTGLGKRLTRANPLHRVDEIWDDIQPQMESSFVEVFPEVQRDVADWLKSRSTTTGS